MSHLQLSRNGKRGLVALIAAAALLVSSAAPAFAEEAAAAEATGSSVESTVQPSAEATVVPAEPAPGPEVPVEPSPTELAPEPAAAAVEPAAEPAGPVAPAEPAASSAAAEPEPAAAELSATPVLGPIADPVSLLVTADPGVSVADQAAIVTRHGGRVTRTIAALRTTEVEVASSDVDAALSSYRSDISVTRVEVAVTRKAAGAASDPSYASQWALPKIGFEDAHGVIAPAGTAVLAVLDTGVQSSDVAQVEGWSAFGTDPQVDPNGHGTAMASIAAATTGNDEGIAGVAYAGVKVMSVQVLAADGTGEDGDVVSGIVHAADNGADVILMAFSNPTYSQTLQDAIDYAWSKGAVLVAATGNAGSTAPTYPAGHAKVVGVSATDRDDTLAATSNSGEGTFLGAPGVGITAAAAGGGTRTISGTSASAAVVAGAAAQLDANDGASNGVIVGRLARTADAAGTTSDTGNGRVNLARALGDTGSDALVPAGTNGAATGGPFVGPYAAANKSPVITFAGNGGGTVSFSGLSHTAPAPSCTSTCSPQFNNFETGTFTAIANADSAFTGWTSPSANSPGSITCQGMTCTFSLGNKDQSVTATFAAKRSTTTAVTCSPASVVEGAATTCTTTVSDSDTGTTSPPTGSVSVSQTGVSGAFTPSAGTCTLGSPTATASSCSVSFTPSSSGTASVSAAYAAASHRASSTATAVSVAVTPATVTTTTTAADKTVTYGATSVLLTATVAPTSVNVGTVDFVVTGVCSVTSGTVTAGTATATCTIPANKPVGEYSIASTYSGGSGFTGSSAAAKTLTISARAITVTADATSQVYGEAAKTLTYKITSGPLADSDALTGSLARVAGTNVGTYAISQGSLDNTNYDIEFVGANYAITARPITVTAVTDTKTFDATTSSAGAPTVAATVVSPALTSPAIVGADAASFSQVFSSASVGTGKTLVPSGSVATAGFAGSNYLITFVNDTTGEITARAITVTADATSQVYGEAVKTLTYKITSGSLADSDALTGSLARVAGTNVGTYAISQGSLDNTNYDIEFVGANYAITARPITVTAVTDTKTYDATTSSAGTPTVARTVVSPALTGPAVLATDTDSFTQAFLTAAVGTAKTLVPSGSVSTPGLLTGSNYDITFVDNAIGVISTRAITVTADATSQVYGEAVKTLTYKITSGSLADLDALTGSLARVAGTNVGTYAISQGSLDNTNYDIEFVGASYAITARPITVTAVTDSKTYDGTTGSDGVPTVVSPALTGPAVLATDTDSFTQAFLTVAVGTAKTLVPSGSVSTPGLLTGSNYDITFVDNSTGVITQRAVTVSAAAKSQVYGEAARELTYSITTGSVVSGETLLGELERATGSNVGTYAIGRGSLTAAANPNYAITFQGANYVITARPITVTAVTDSKTYDGTTGSDGVPTVAATVVSPALTGPAVLATDTDSFTQAFLTVAVGTAKTLVPSGSVSTPGLLTGSNYDITFVDNSTGVITQRAVTVSAAAKSQVYGEAARELTYSITTGSVVSGETLLGELERATGSNVGTYAIGRGSLTAAANPNYAITFQGANYVITARPITVTAVTDSKTYDGTASSSATPTVTLDVVSPALTGTTIVSGDTASFSQMFTNALAGTGKTLVPSGSVSTPGFTGSNYGITVVNNTTGVITPREGRVAYIGQTVFYTSGSSSTTTQAALSASVSDVDGSGLVSNATVSFTDMVTGKVLASGVKVAPVANSIGTGTANTVVTLSTGQYGALSYLIVVRLTGDYTNSQQTGADPLSDAYKAAHPTLTAMIPATANSTQGGATLTKLASAAGKYGDATVASYSMGLKYNKGGTSPQGQVQLVLTRADGTYYVKSNSITSLGFAAIPTGATAPKDVTVYTKASIYKVGPNGTSTGIEGNVTLRIDAHEGCFTGSCTSTDQRESDTIGFTVLSTKDSALFYSNNWVYATNTKSWRTVQQPVTGTSGSAVVIN